jgi:Protein of unknown function (DUF2911)
MTATRFLPAVALALAALAAPVRADLVLPRVSQGATVSQTIGVTQMTLAYSRPGVKGRPIWGALVPYGKPWRTGANEATTFTTTDPIVVAGQKLPAGTYSFFTVPARGAWTVIFSRQKDLWGAFSYDSTQDQLRISATPDTTAPHTEWMALGFENLSTSSCDLVLRWEKLRLAVPIVVNVNDRVLADSRAAIAAAKPDDWRTLYRAASWTFDAGTAPDEGRAWLERSIGIQPNVQNMRLKALWLAKEGKTADAIAAGERAVALGKAAKEKDVTPVMEKQVADWKASSSSSKK